MEDCCYNFARTWFVYRYFFSNSSTENYLHNLPRKECYRKLFLQFFAKACTWKLIPATFPSRHGRVPRQAAWNVSSLRTQEIRLRKVYPISLESRPRCRCCCRFCLLALLRDLTLFKSTVVGFIHRDVRINGREIFHTYVETHT